MPHAATKSVIIRIIIRTYSALDREKESMLSIRILTLRQYSTTAMTLKPTMSLTLAVMSVAVAVMILMTVVEELPLPHDSVAVYNLILLLLPALER